MSSKKLRAAQRRKCQASSGGTSPPTRTGRLSTYVASSLKGRRPLLQFWLLKLFRVLELLGWLLLLRLFVALALLTLAALGCVLLGGLVFGGPQLLRAQTYFVSFALREGIAVGCRLLKKNGRAQLLELLGQAQKEPWKALTAWFHCIRYHHHPVSSTTDVAIRLHAT